MIPPDDIPSGPEPGGYSPISCDAISASLNSAMPVLFLSIFVGVAFIILIYLLGLVFSNRSTSSWAKVEFMELIFTSFFVVIFSYALPIYCSIDVSSLYSSSGSGEPMYSAGEKAILRLMKINNDVIDVSRYHLGALNLLEATSLWTCDTGQSGFLGFFASNCFFGMGGSGYSYFAGFSVFSQALYMILQSAVIAKVSLIINLLILRLTYSGLFLFFFPLGLLIRSVPGMRVVGSFMVSLPVAFLLIYPLVMATFYDYTDHLQDIIKNNINPPEVDYETLVSVSHDNNDAISLGGLAGGPSSGDSYSRDMFKKLFGEYPGEYTGISRTISYGAASFIAGIFIPNLALLATISTLYYLTRALGINVDLSKLSSLM
ncbi:MAG: hypothetical protein QW035_04620 [Candidatus Anstonellales archaeon]